MRVKCTIRLFESHSFCDQFFNIESRSPIIFNAARPEVCRSVAVGITGVFAGTPGGGRDIRARGTYPFKETSLFRAIFKVVVEYPGSQFVICGDCALIVGHAILPCLYSRFLGNC